MSLISKRIKSYISLWAELHENKEVYPKISATAASYYVDRINEDSYIMEYSLSSLPEVKEILTEYSGLESEPVLLKCMTMEICQNYYISRENRVSEETGKPDISDNQIAKGVLSEYRYEF